MKWFCAVASVLVTLLAAGTVFAAEPSDVAFVDVNTIPMDRERVEAHQTVVVHDGTIVAAGPAARVRPPASAKQVQCGGRLFLLPGLADMHTHVSEETDLGLYIANGVTTILHMGGTEQRLVGHIRGDIDRGEVVGPQMFFSLMIDGSDAFGILHVTDAEVARAAVKVARSVGYDFLKVYNNLTPDEFAALVDEGRRLGLPVVGHGVRAVGLPEALFLGQVMVAHAEEFLYTAFKDRRDEARLASVVAQVKQSGAYVTPTLSTYETITRDWGRPEVIASWLALPETQTLSPTVRQRWARSFYAHRPPEDLAPELVFQRRLTLAFLRAGVPLLAGTDSPEVPGMFPGASLHAELKALVASGFSPFEALSAATRTPGDFIQATHPDRQRFGVIEVGRRADLILVEANPLQDIAALDHLTGVLAHGRWFDQPGLEALQAERRAAYTH